MEEKIKPEVIDKYKKIQDAGYEAYLVGGSVRDLLLNRPVKDWDLTTNAKPEEIQKLFPDSFYDNTYGTVGVPVKNNDQTDFVIEITTYRSESEYHDRRHPEKIEWGKTVEDDLARRDFTINAVALPLKKEVARMEEIPTARTKITSMEPWQEENSRQDPELIKLIDPFKGQQDLEKKLIRAVRNPRQRFKEDALRLMRAIRLATQLNFEIEKDTWIALCEDAPLIQHVSYERIRDELFKILASPSALSGIQMLDASGILAYILPELEEGKGVSQVRPGRHHTTDVFTHNIMSMHHCPSKDPLVKLAALLHDVGKPQVAATDEDGYIVFYNHEVAGAITAKKIADRLHLSRKQRDKLYTLIRWHMFTVNEHATDSAIRRFIRNVGIENVADMIDLRIGDRLGSGTQTAQSWRLKKFKERIEKELNPAFSINDLAIDGHDIMKELGLKPGPQVGKILKILFEEVDENLNLNNKEHLVKRLHQILSQEKDL